MKVVETPPVEIAIRTLSDEDRRRVWALFDHLKNWENDAYVRQSSERLASASDVYLLKTSDVYLLKTSNDIRIFFTLKDDRIEILDIATRAGIMSSAHSSGRP